MNGGAWVEHGNGQQCGGRYSCHCGLQLDSASYGVRNMPWARLALPVSHDSGPHLVAITRGAVWYSWLCWAHKLSPHHVPPSYPRPDRSHVERTWRCDCQQSVGLLEGGGRPVTLQQSMARAPSRSPVRVEHRYEWSIGQHSFKRTKRPCDKRHVTRSRGQGQVW